LAPRLGPDLIRARGDGEIVAAGTPEAVVKEKRSYTGAFLKPVLTRRGVSGKKGMQAAEYNHRPGTSHCPDSKRALPLSEIAEAVEYCRMYKRAVMLNFRKSTDSWGRSDRNNWLRNRNVHCRHCKPFRGEPTRARWASPLEDQIAQR
jgi:ABC-type proline/glycine betaine transport system ATPase subunit